MFNPHIKPVCYHNSGSNAGGGAALPPKPVTTGAGAENVGAGEPNGFAVGVTGANGFGADVLGVFGAGLTGVGLVAASSAFILASLSFPANIIPDNVPVKNVAIGIINSKNFWSIGEMALRGCVTKMIEYKTTNTIPVNVKARQIPMKKRRRAISWSSV